MATNEIRTISIKSFIKYKDDTEPNLRRIILNYLNLDKSFFKDEDLAEFEEMFKKYYAED